MNKRKVHANQDKSNRRMIAALAMTFLIILSAPSFAENGTGMPEQSEKADVQVEDTGSEVNDNAEGSLQYGEDEQTDETGEREDEEDLPAETDPDLAEEENAASDQSGDTGVLTQKSVMLKASSAQKVSYTGNRVGSDAGETSVFKVTKDGTTYTGACAEQGVAMKTSGTATISRISNSTKIAKVIYHYAIELDDKNWWTSSHKTDKVGKILGMDKAGDTDVTKRRMVECFCQIYNMGSSTWYKTITNSSTGGWSTNTADKVRDYYKGIDTSKITVPDEFEIWFADAGNAQPFIMWAYTPKPANGYVKMKKVSGKTAITG